MRHLRLILVLLALLVPAGARAEAVLRGFDHADHAARLEKRGKPVECTRCHNIGKGGKLAKFPDKKHRPCSDAGCHSPWPLTPTKQEGETYCLVCHDPADVKAKKIDSFYPPFDVNPDHRVPFPHARHAVPGATGKLCAQCHPGHGEPAGTGTLTSADAHATCSGCHERGAEPVMSKCAGCHKDKTVVGPPLAPAPWDDYRVSQRFDHAKHAATVGNEEGRRCSTCHDSLQQAKDGVRPPRPKMETCGKCHDGQKAAGGGKVFAVTGSCNRCHGLPPDMKLAAAPPPPANAPQFSHADHAKKGVNVNQCATCHTLDGKWLAETPTKGKAHAPCADAKCHREEFFARTTTVCGGCHADARPFAPARFTPLGGGAGSAEFGRDFSHLSHVKNLGAGGNNFCAKCHQGRFEAQATAQSHGTCAPCHGGDASPRMSECQGCHALGAPRGTLPTRDPSYPWYVRAKFQHDDHDVDPRSGQETTCLLCHDQVVQATKLAEIGRPRMAQCDACHNGKNAFKTTGFGCYRCHGAKK
jgi:c(7)-type cytochrome triheme protein